MNLGIAGRKAIVCASSRGLGKATARALAEAGCEVVINGRDKGKLEAAAADWEELPPTFLTSAEDRRGREELLAYIHSMLKNN